MKTTKKITILLPLHLWKRLVSEIIFDEFRFSKKKTHTRMFFLGVAVKFFFHGRSS
jgi:hypothetical protein